MRALLALLIVCFFTLSGTASAQQCAPLPDFLRSVASNGFEPVVSAKDSDGDKIVIFLNAKNLEWIAVFLPQQAPVACLVSSGTEFKVTLTGGV